ELEQTFKALHFHVIIHKLLSVSDVLSTLREVAHQQGHYRASAFVCCIISRSRSSDLLATESNCPGLNLNTVRRLFTPDFLNSSLSRAIMCLSLRGVLGAWVVKMRRVESWRQTGQWSYAARGAYHHCSTEEKQLEVPNHQSLYLKALRSSLTE
ncbi:hypothetical protein M9458_019416, partial [Cirrhinus mrigala]